MPYTLITVTYGGEVHHSRGYETLRMCQEARSIALTGMTIAENEEADRQYAERCRKEREAKDAKLRAEWLIEHPGRLPTPEEQEGIKRGVLEWKRDPWSGHEKAKHYRTSMTETALLAISKSCLASDGLVYDQFVVVGGGSSGCSPSYSTDRGESVDYIRGGWVKRGPKDIKSAHCVVEVADAPAREAGIAA